MKTKLLFITLIFFALGGLIFISSVKAAVDSASDINQEVKEMAGLDQEISAEDLGVKSKMFLLPDSRFYPLKNFWRKTKMVFTFNPIKKVELQQRFANEKLMEVKKVYEKNKDPEQAEKLLEKYSKEAELISERIGKIVKSPKNQTGIDNLLDNLTDHLLKREKVVQDIKERLENKLSPEKYKKITEQLDLTVGKLGVKIGQLEENRELLKERFVKIAERQEGSEFKNFKNLEILKNIEEKMSLGTSAAIKQARETIEEKFIQDMNKMDVEKKVRFKNYINEIKGDAVRHLEIIKEMESEEIKKGIIEKKEIIEEQYSQKSCKDLCGDGICQEIVCEAIGCPCAETAESCPEDCKKNSDCAKEGEKVNRNPLMGSIDKQCCPGLIENRVSKSYSVCEKPIEQTCDAKCKSLNYKSGICRTWPIVPDAERGCKENEKEIGQTSDCTTFRTVNGMDVVSMGVGETCCCQKGNFKVESRINKR